MVHQIPPEGPGVRCWRCEAENVVLMRDPLCPDFIGVCLNCANERALIYMRSRLK